MCIGAAVAHFLSCLIGACPNPAAGVSEGPGSVRGARGAGPPRGGRGRRARRLAHSTPAPPSPHPDWQNLTPKALFSQIKQELKVSFISMYHDYSWWKKSKTKKMLI